MLTLNREILQEGRLGFEQYFKKELEKNGVWNVKFQWGENIPYKKDSLLGVEINANIILDVSNKDIAEFAADPCDESYRVKVLEKKQKALIKKMRIP